MELGAFWYTQRSQYEQGEASTRADRPELLRMVADLQPGGVIIAELPEPTFLDDECPSADLPVFIDTAYIRSLYGWEPGETVEEAIARHQSKQCSSS